MRNELYPSENRGILLQDTLSSTMNISHDVEETFLFMVSSRDRDILHEPLFSFTIRLGDAPDMNTCHLRQTYKNIVKLSCKHAFLPVMQYLPTKRQHTEAYLSMRDIPSNIQDGSNEFLRNVSFVLYPRDVHFERSIYDSIGESRSFSMENNTLTHVHCRLTFPWNSELIQDVFHVQKMSIVYCSDTTCTILCDMIPHEAFPTLRNNMTCSFPVPSETIQNPLFQFLQKTVLHKSKSYSFILQDPFRIMMKIPLTNELYFYITQFPPELFTHEFLYKYPLLIDTYQYMFVFEMTTRSKKITYSTSSTTR